MTQFQKDYASIKWSPEARAGAGQVNVGMEAAVSGFNALDSDETLYWAAVTGNTPVIRGNYLLTNNAAYKLDLAASVTNTATKLRITIKDGADWAIKGGGTQPVVAGDYAFTYNVITDPRNPVASTTGYDQIDHYTMPGGANGKTIDFYWRTGHAFAHPKDLFGFILPRFALPSAAELGANNGQLFDEMWRDCVCVQTVGGDGHLVDGLPVSDGPFFVSSYDPGTGVIDTPNNRWYGPDPLLSQVNFVRITPGSTEINALQGGQLDVSIPPPPGGVEPGYDSFQSDPQFVYQVRRSLAQEHMDLNEANPLLAHLWMRRAIMLGINRPAAIKAAYVDTHFVPAGTVRQLNSGEFVVGPYAAAPYDYFKYLNFDPTKALSILSSHCTGGPTSPNPNNTKIWQCPDGPATFEWWSTTEPVRAQNGTIFQSQLKAIGIQLNLHSVSGGVLDGNVLPSAQTNSCIDDSVSPPVPQPCGADTYDIAEYGSIGSPDPSGFNSIYECYDGNGNGAGNFENFCNITINNELRLGDSDLTSMRINHYLTVSKLLAKNAYLIPLYARPNLLIYRTSVGGGITLANNSTSQGPTWNMETWTG